MPGVLTERRWHTRVLLSVPITVQGEEHEILGTGRTVGISEGGALLLLPSEIIPRLGGTMFVELCVPGSVTGDGEPREVSSEAKILRHRPVKDRRELVAIQFVMALELGLRDRWPQGG